MSGPRASVVMSAYNAEATVGAAVESILAQTFGDFEFIIVDDGSTDRTPAIVSGFADRRIRLIRNPRNLGLAAALNRGIAATRGEYVARMDADDGCRPERLALEVAFLDEHPAFGLVGTGFEIMDMQGRPVDRRVRATDDETLQAQLLGWNPFCHGSVMMRRGMLRRVGGYDERFHCAQDTDLWLRLAEVCRVATLGRVLYAWRRRAGSVSVAHRGRQVEQAGRARRLAWERRTTGRDALGRRLELSPSDGSARRLLAEHGVVWGREALRQRRRREAATLLMRADREAATRGGPSAPEEAGEMSERPGDTGGDRSPVAQHSGATGRLPLRRRVLFSVVVALLCLAVVLVAAEIMVRLLRPHYTVEDLRNEALLYRGSIFCRHILLKERRVIKDIPHPESAAIVINDRGYRGAPFAAAKPPGTIRIVFLGGSSVFGFRLKGPGSDWPHRVQRLLRAGGHRRVECINAGIPGHATFDSLGRLYSEIHLFDPDWIVLYQTYNDFEYFGWLSAEHSLLAHYGPYSGSDPRITYQGWLDRLLCRSQLYTKLRTHYLWRKYRGWRPGERGRTKLRRDGALSDAALRQYRLNVSLICDAAKEIRANVMLVSQARLARKGGEGQVTAEDGTTFRVDDPELADAFDRCDAILREVAAGKGAVFLDASSQMSGEPKYFVDPVHLTPEGAERLAVIVAEAFERLLEAGKRDE